MRALVYSLYDTISRLQVKDGQVVWEEGKERDQRGGDSRVYRESSQAPSWRRIQETRSASDQGDQEVRGEADGNARC